MEDIRPDGAWYAVYLDGDASRAVVDVHAVSKALPHGSGLDTDWHITVRRNGDLALATELHTMDKHGCYSGWRTVRASVKRVRAEVRHQLGSGGYYQVTNRLGDIVLAVATRGDLGDCLYETLYDALAPVLTRTPDGYQCFGPTDRPAVFVREDGFVGWREVADVIAEP